MANSMIGWIAAAVGGYIIYEKFFANQTVPAGAVTQTIQPGTTPTQNLTSTTTNITASTNNPGSLAVSPYEGAVPSEIQAALNAFQKKVASAGLSNTLQNTDTWNWYLSQPDSANYTGPAPETMGISPRNALMTLPNYLNMITRYLNGVQSLNGIPGLVGLGRIIPANYQGQHPTGRDYRSFGMNKPAAIPTGWDRANKVIQ